MKTPINLTNIISCVVLALAATTSFAETKEAQLNRCIKRIEAAGCKLSGNNEDRIEANADECKELKSADNKTEVQVLLLKQSAKVVVIQTEGLEADKVTANYKEAVGKLKELTLLFDNESAQAAAAPLRGNCPTIKYTIDKQGISDILVLGKHMYMLSNDGALYMMSADEAVSEIKNSSGDSYKGITDIAGVKGEPGTLKIKGLNFETKLTEQKIEARKKEPVRFTVHLTNESLFRDK